MTNLSASTICIVFLSHVLSLERRVQRWTLSSSSSSTAAPAIRNMHRIAGPFSRRCARSATRDTVAGGCRRTKNKWTDYLKQHGNRGSIIRGSLCEEELEIPLSDACLSQMSITTAAFLILLGSWTLLAPLAGGTRDGRKRDSCFLVFKKFLEALSQCY